MTPTPEQVALVKTNLPDAAMQSEVSGGYGWTDEFIVNLMVTNTLSPAGAVRHFWLERVNETAEYLDIGKPLTQIHSQAKAMLDYWDKIINGFKADDMVPTEPARNTKPLTFGEIERPYV